MPPEYSSLSNFGPENVVQAIEHPFNVLFWTMCSVFLPSHVDFLCQIGLFYGQLLALCIIIDWLCNESRAINVNVIE